MRMNCARKRISGGENAHNVTVPMARYMDTQERETSKDWVLSCRIDVKAPVRVHVDTMRATEEE